ncbi:autotransporter outer membrane beta-barrel domain-containing protein [Desulfospira joergensenii]|uniref:autotransporter outer membrane beta-barrel domain-containing protein n=1 Tax=Desulfospira joergensenii TaxID=53329 RepID=UPI00129469DE|nr:autotransporter outer membrane beta-barrel domain-containing protein [Desulfospira joergensenii]
MVDGNTESASIVVAGISSWGSDTIVNKGNITVHAETGAAMSGTSNVFSYSTASGIDCGNVNNTGELRVSSQGGTGVGSVYNLSSAEAIGLSGWSSVLNTGNISVIARGGDSTAPVSQDAYAEAVGIRSKGNIYSEGKISVTAIAGKERPNAAAAYTSSNATAYGILINENGATIHSKGLIQVRATLYPGLSGGVQEARQVYVNDGTTTITGYAMELNTQNGFTTEYAGTIGLNTGAAAYFSDATLYLTLGKNFSGKSEYELPTLVDGAVISDQFAVLSPLPVDYKAGLVNGNGTTPQKIRVEFTPKHSPALKSAQVRNQLSSRMNGMFYSNVLSNILTDPLTRPESSQTSAFGQKPEYLVAALGNSFGPLSFVPEKSRDFVFASPIVSTFKNNSATGYEADAIGIMGGVTRALSDRFFFGGHIGITQNEIKFTGQGYDKRSDDTDTYSLGGHAVYLHDDTWLFSCFGTLSYSHSDYQDLATNNKESAAFGSNGFRMDSSLGYRLRAWNQTFLPEMGLAYAWSHQAAFTTDNTSGPNVTHGTMDEHDLYARLGMKWFTQADSKNGWALYPSLGFWVSQALTDAEFSSTMSVGAASRRVTDQEDETTLITEAGITLSNGRTTLSANYNGGDSDNVRNHMFWFEAGISF